MANEPEKRVIFLGTLDTTDFAATSISISPDMDPSEIQAAIERANAERLVTAAAETAHLKRKFLGRVALDE
jgi:hypothetical protein